MASAQTTYDCGLCGGTFHGRPAEHVATFYRTTGNGLEPYVGLSASGGVDPRPICGRCHEDVADPPSPRHLGGNVAEPVASSPRIPETDWNGRISNPGGGDGCDSAAALSASIAAVKARVLDPDAFDPFNNLGRSVPQPMTAGDAPRVRDDLRPKLAATFKGSQWDFACMEVYGLHRSKQAADAHVGRLIDVYGPAMYLSAHEDETMHDRARWAVVMAPLRAITETAEVA